MALAGCKYERQPNCHLDVLGLKGDVVKVETLVQSTVPITELYAYGFYPASCISMYCGNITLKFDRHGFVNRYEGYGIDGALLFSKKEVYCDKSNNMEPTALGATHGNHINEAKTLKTTDGKVTEASYCSNDKVVWTQQTRYNADGSLSRIVKSYADPASVFGNRSHAATDTTYFRYLSYDAQHNWTEAQVDYRAPNANQCVSYKIKRQITYNGESEKDELMKQLSTENVHEVQASQIGFYQINIDYGNISIPSFLTQQTEGDATSGAYVTPKGDPYFSFSENVSDCESTRDVYFSRGYTSADDESIRVQFTNTLAQHGIYIMRWLPYETVEVSPSNAIHLRYYRFGLGSPVPVYVEMYVIPVSKTELLNITYGFQSDRYDTFKGMVEKSLNSLSLNLNQAELPIWEGQQ